MPNSLASLSGLLLLLLALLLSVATEHGARDVSGADGLTRETALEWHVAQPPLSPPEGRWLRVVGTPQIARPPQDPDFNQTAATPLLLRRVEMFQWRETQAAGHPSYTADWADHPLDSTHFAEPQGHGNPGAFPVQAASFEAGAVTMGGFELAPAIVRALPGAITIPPQPGRLAANLTASFSHDGNYLTTSGQPDHPQPGDLRVHWEAIQAQPLTVLARVSGARLVATPNGPGDSGFVVRPGDQPLNLLLSRPSPAVADPIWRRLLALALGLAGGCLLGRQMRWGPWGGAAAGILPPVLAALWLWRGQGLHALAGWLILALAAAAAWLFFSRRHRSAGQ